MPLAKGEHIEIILMAGLGSMEARKHGQQHHTRHYCQTY